MTLAELKQQLQEKQDQLVGRVEGLRITLRQAEIDLAFAQGQLHALNMINITEPVYSNGAEDNATTPNP